VSKSWNETCKQEHLWRNLCYRDFSRRNRFDNLLRQIRENMERGGDSVTFSLASTKAGVDTRWLRRSNRLHMWKSLYDCVPRIRFDGFYFLRQQHVSPRDTSWVDETTMTDEDFEESWKPVVRLSYRYFRFFPCGRVHFLQHYLPPSDSILDEISRVPRGAGGRDFGSQRRSRCRRVQYGSYHFRPRKRTVLAKILQEKYIMHFDFRATSAEKTNCCLTRLYVDRHVATPLISDDDSGEDDEDRRGRRELVFNMHEPYEFYGFVRCAF